ncbi:hypothetical protein SAMN04489727_1965 [Amycolatopsis tolypomycina]|uniref:Uncharacterized protein n=1 Tax=Amycolatopsis tolypomycina TaxID=208445 RepID=A0A1H4JJN9_9PSEU|nr:hypothetical protein [Amycolatopsis tolypomycina]SEB46511.1 hypothetical protein SAMN04489727_1965 [Amycolatopsis tolypomycina]
MSALTTTRDSSADVDLAAGEHWVELVPAAHGEPHQLSFPAVIEPRRRHGLWVRPRLRREVAEVVCEWLNLVYPVDPDWYPLARFEDDRLVVFTGDAAHQRHEIALGDDGRYPLGEMGRWFLSGPTRTPALLDRREEVLRDAARRPPRPGETLVTCAPGNPSRSGFPARIETRPGQAWVPVFRPEIAEAVAAWCTTNHVRCPDEHPLVHFDGDTLVHVHQRWRARDSYLPWRIGPDADGNYPIAGDEWAFEAVTEKSEGEVHEATAAPAWPRLSEGDAGSL